MSLVTGVKCLNLSIAKQLGYVKIFSAKIRPNCSVLVLNCLLAVEDGLVNTMLDFSTPAGCLFTVEAPDGSHFWTLTSACVLLMF